MKYIGIDIGGTDIKAAVAADGRLVCVKEYDWNPAASPTAEGIIAPIELLVRLMACCAAGQFSFRVLRRSSAGSSRWGKLPMSSRKSYSSTGISGMVPSLSR